MSSIFFIRLFYCFTLWFSFAFVLFRHFVCFLFLTSFNTARRRGHTARPSCTVLEAAVETMPGPAQLVEAARETALETIGTTRSFSKGDLNLCDPTAHVFCPHIFGFFVCSKIVHIVHFLAWVYIAPVPGMGGLQFLINLLDDSVTLYNWL